MPQDGRQQGAYPSEAAESPLSERAALALGRRLTRIHPRVRHVERVVLGLVNAPRHLNPLLSGGVEARKSIQQTGSAWL